MTTELLQELEPYIEQFTLVPSEGGKFEVTVNQQLVFSKLEKSRHAEPGEVLGLVKRFVQETA